MLAVSASLNGSPGGDASAQGRSPDARVLEIRSHSTIETTIETGPLARGRAARLLGPPNSITPSGKTEELEGFWSWDFHLERYFRLRARRVHVSPSVWIYVEEGLTLPGPDLLRIAGFFEDRALPDLRRVLGSEPRPGIDGQDAVTVLLTDIRDAHHHRLPAEEFVSGYFDPANQRRQADLDAQDAGRRSNEREMIYIDIGAPVDSSQDDILRAIAHELAHLVLWNADPDEEAWLEEGLSELGAFLSGLGHPRQHVNLYLRNTELALTSWSGEPEEIGKGYLFALYLHDRFELADPGWLRDLVASEMAGIRGLEGILAGEGVSPAEVFLDFLLALHLAGSAPDDPRFRFASIQLGSSQPPDGFRAPAARRHDSDRPLDDVVSLDAWSANVRRISHGQRDLRVRMSLSQRACAALSIQDLSREPAAPLVDGFCLRQAADRHWRIPALAEGSGPAELLSIQINPETRAVPAGFRLDIDVGFQAFLPSLHRR